MAFIDCHFFSDALGLSASMYVVIPQPAAGQIGMASRGRRGGRYPVLYLLHGLSDDHTIWMRRTSIERYASERGVAVVMPAGGRSFYQDMASGPRFWTHVSEEVPRLARAFFPLSERREDTFVAGLSMGGYGALRMALVHPDRFAAAGSFSGAVNLARHAKKVRDESPEWRRERESNFGRGGKVAGTPSDLFALAQDVARSRGSKPRLFQYCGTQDFLYQDNLNFRDLAQRLKLDLTYREDGGNHAWQYWDEQILAFLKWAIGK